MSILAEPPAVASGSRSPIHEALRRAVCRPTLGYLWVPGEPISFTPALADTIYGDGRALIHISTIQSRPRYYVVRIDSGWYVDGDRDAPNCAPALSGLIGSICIDLARQFGTARLAGLPGLPWPALDATGRTWRRVSWPAIAGLATVAHPWSTRHSILREKASRS